MGNGEKGSNGGDNGDGKPDLSDLKSRLGLDRESDERKGEANRGQRDRKQKSEASSEPSRPRSGSASEPSERAKQKRASDGENRRGPDQTPSGSKRPGPKPSGPPDEQSPLSGDELDAVGQSIFSPKIISFTVIAAIVAGIIGMLAGQTMKTRELVEAQRDDAARIHEALAPLVDKFKKVRSKLNELDLEKANFEAAKTLAEYDLAPESNLLGGDRLLLGKKAIDFITAYVTEARMLENLLDRHDQFTNEVDKNQLQQLMEDEKIAGDDQYAVLFDYRYVASKSGRDDYIPKSGALVKIPPKYVDEDKKLTPNDEGKVLARRLASAEERMIPVRSLIPVPKQNLVRTGGPNALQRYQERIGHMRRHTKKMSEYVDQMLGRLQKIKNRDSAPLIEL